MYRHLFALLFSAAFLSAPAQIRAQDVQAQVAPSPNGQTPQATALDHTAAQDNAEQAEPDAEPAPPLVDAAASPDGQAAAAPAGSETTAPAPPTTPSTAAQPPALAPSAVAAARRPEDITLRVATWAGAYEQAQRRAVLDDFAARTRYQMTIVARVPGTDELGTDELGMAQDGAVWDLADVSAASAERGCRDGVLEPMDASFLPPGVEGDPAMMDFLPGALRHCAVASSVWSSVIVFNPRAFTGKPPAMLADLFDVEGFPGKRVLPKSPRFLFELALRADGVAPVDIYPTLSTPDGQARAFAKLDAISDHIVWVGDAADTLSLLGAGEIAMALAFNGRAFAHIASSREPLGIIWDGQIYQMNYWVIARGSENAAQARELIASATAPETMAALTRWLPYGPVRRSALPLVGRHAELEIDMAAFVPTMPQNFAGALAFDARWWDEQDGMLETQFDEWLARQDRSGVPALPVPAGRGKTE